MAGFIAESIEDLTWTAERKWLFALCSLLAGPIIACVIVYLIGSFTATSFNIYDWTIKSRVVAVMGAAALSVVCTTVTVAMGKAALQSANTQREEAIDRLAQGLRGKSAIHVPSSRTEASGREADI